MQEVRTELDTNPDDYTDGRETIIAIIEAAEEICQSLNSGTPLPDLSVPTALSTQVSEEMIDITPTP
jgi:hypothetical protein